MQQFMEMLFENTIKSQSYVLFNYAVGILHIVCDIPVQHLIQKLIYFVLIWHSNGANVYQQILPVKLLNLIISFTCT